MLDKAKAREIATAYTTKVRETHSPKQVILFGSYSYVDGDPHEHSDINIAVIFDSVKEKWLEAWDA